MRLKIPISVLILFLHFGRRYQTTNLKPHFNAIFTTVPVLTVHHTQRCSGEARLFLISNVNEAQNPDLCSYFVLRFWTEVPNPKSKTPLQCQFHYSTKIGVVAGFHCTLKIVYIDMFMGQPHFILYHSVISYQLKTVENSKPCLLDQHQKVHNV